MDNASAYGAEDCRFDPCRGRVLFRDQWLQLPRSILPHSLNTVLIFFFNPIILEIFPFSAIFFVKKKSATVCDNRWPFLCTIDRSYEE